jgi:hypothetical protein
MILGNNITQQPDTGMTVFQVRRLSAEAYLMLVHTSQDVDTRKLAVEFRSPENYLKNERE